MSNVENFNFEHRHQLADSIEGHFSQTLSRLTELVAIPSVAWESFDLKQVERSAEKVRDLALAIGFESADILSSRYGSPERTGMPAVIARKKAQRGFPTIVLYAHHDVQPAGDLDLWETDPFTATQKEDRLYGRGVADDKAGILAHLAAFEAVKEVLGEDFRVGVTLFIEGEEEAGSPSFSAFLKEYQDRLAGDIIVVADSANWRTGVPALTTSLRGVVSATISLRVGSHAVHSGMFGGPMLDATTAMVHLLSSLHKTNGAVAVKGLKISSQPELEYSEDSFRADSGILPSVSLAGEGSIASRLWAQPALSIIGIDATAVNESSNTLSVTSRAKISLRLAPGQDPDEAHNLLEEHILSHVPWGAKVSYERNDSGRPYAADTSEKSVQLALAALSSAWGVEAVQTGMGGSIPFIADLKQAFPRAHILITGIEDPDTRAHSANESLYIPDIKKAILAEALILSNLSQQQ